MKKTVFFILVCAGILFAGCNSNPDESSKVGEGGTLKERLESAKTDDVIDIAAENLTSTKDASLTVNKALTIKNGDVSGSTFEVTVPGVIFDTVTGAKQFLVAESVGDGEFTVTNCGDVKYLIANGGGSNSIHIASTKITNATANKDGVRILLKDKKSQIANITINKPCILESEEAGEFSHVVVAGSDNSVALRGKTKIEELVVASSKNEVFIGSNEVTIAQGADICGGGINQYLKVEEGTEGVELPRVDPMDITPTWKLWTDPNEYKGTASITDFSSDSITVTASETPTHNPWDANLNFWYKLEKETQYLIEFEAKFDGEPKETTFNVYDGTKKMNIAVAPFSPTSEWKKYTFMLPIDSNGANEDFEPYKGDDIEFSFRLTKGTLSVKGFTVYDCWAEDFKDDKLGKWDVWFSAGSGASVMMYDVSETAAKANRRVESGGTAIEDWKTNVGYKMGALTAGEHFFLVRSNGGSLHTLNVHIASDGGKYDLGTATGFAGEGLYYVIFTVPEKRNNQEFVMQFYFNRDETAEWQEDRLDVSEIQYGPKATLQIPAGAKKLSYTPKKDAN